MELLKVALIGVGAIAESTHLVYVKEHPDVSIEAIVDVNLERAKKLAEAHGVRHYFSSIDELIASIQVDAVIISTPNQTHMPIAKRAAEHGIHVFVEKPIGTDVSEVEEFLEVARKNNVITMVGMPHRFRRDVQVLKEYAEQNTFGNVYYVKATLFRRRGTPKGWFTNKALAGGGAMMDIGVHVLDLAWWLMGQPKAHSITGKTLSGLGDYQTKFVSSWESKNKSLNANHVFDVEDFGAAWIRFENGAVLSLEISWAINGDQNEAISIDIFGDKGGATLSPLAIFKEENGVLGKTTPIFQENQIFKDEMHHFIECIRTKAKPLITGEDGYEVLKMLLAIYESSEKQKEVIL
ncbi:MAG TPA: Gfo/Idh/MocA family oxidoreductase [Bacillus sp. (in: firmicutes)]|uniref:Gfo/Idh/MocA family protein n=1 Tax=Bacillus litorisediminis TaxID=2922713 RepID=UPI001FAD175E|nr:Gfo/Idh/MocA family oxidoreductase [Bacillus litorisediminis]HWO76624.1 Gfo/Idh/MocA family oxidoreductase [Bacillus sp. (in: firmicutes)]